MGQAQADVLLRHRGDYLRKILLKGQGQLNQSRGGAMLKVIGGVIVYGFAIFGLGVYLQSMHARRKEEAKQ